MIYFKIPNSDICSECVDEIQPVSWLTELQFGSSNNEQKCDTLCYIVRFSHCECIRSYTWSAKILTVRLH